MDRMIHTALNSIKTMNDVRTTSANNLSSVDIPGFRKDLPNDGGSAFVQAMDQATARVFRMETGKAGFSDAPGPIKETGVKTDISIVSSGYFYVEPTTGGDISLTRRGDFALSPDGFLVNGANEKVLDDNLQPLQLPPFNDIKVSNIGEISIEPFDGPPGQYVSVGRFGLTSAVGETLTKHADSHIRRFDGSVPAPDQKVTIAQGMLEASNVDAVEELVLSLETQRQFEMNIKFIKLAEDIDRGGAELMRLPQN